ncbi:MAG: carboxypeptidase regulatory-like domain-containing protein [Candidatus Brocadia sp.]|jgi:hypothetical protein
MIKILAIVLCMFVNFYAAVNGDTVTLRNDGRDIDLRVTGLTEEYISAIIPKKDLKSLKMQFVDTTKYPDVIFLNVATAAIECKIKEIAEDAIKVLIPTSMISSLRMSFPPENRQLVSAEDEGKPEVVNVVVKKEKAERIVERGTESGILEHTGEGKIADQIRMPPAEKTGREKYYRLKMKKKVEDSEDEYGLSKMEAKDATAGVDNDYDNESFMDERIQELDTKTFGQIQKQASELTDKESADTVKEQLKGKKGAVQGPNLGMVEGRILHSGKPLPDCQVKLQMLEKGGLLTKGYRPVEGAVELEAITDKDGFYRFVNVSPGLYKMYWKPPEETTWVRRFKMEPDVIVIAGKLTKPKDIETLKRTLN